MKKLVLLINVFVICFGSLIANGQEEIDAPSLEEMGFVKEGYPIVQTPVDITVLMPMRPQMQSIGDYKLPQEIAAKTGVNVKMNGIPMSVYSQKKNLLIASGDLPDVFWGQQALSRSDIKKFSESDMVLNINNYIDDYMPNLKSILDREPDYRRYLEDDNGGIYYLPMLVDNLKQPVQGKMYINKKWLDTLGLAVPKTLDDLTLVLRSFKDGDPNGNGIADEIPLVISDMHPATGEIASIVQLFGSFGRHGSGYLVEDDKTVFAPMENEYLEAINYFKSYVEEGLINSDGFFLSITDYWKVFKSSTDNTVGMCFSFGAGDVVAERFEEDYVPLSPVAGPRGDRAWHRIYTVAYGSSLGAAVNARTLYPEVVLRYLDEFYALENSVQTFYGGLGDTLEKDSEGNYKFIDRDSIWEKRYLFTPSDGPLYIKKEFIDSGIAPDLLSESNQIYYDYFKDSDPSYIFPPVDYTDEELEQIRAKMVDIDNYVLATRVTWLTSDEKVTAEEWDYYLQTLRNLGIQEVLDIKDRAFRRANLIFRDFE